MRLLFLFAGITHRIGFGSGTPYIEKFPGALLTRRTTYDAKLSEHENNLRLLEHFSIPVDRTISFSVRADNSFKVNDSRVKIGIHRGKTNLKKPGLPLIKIIDLIAKIRSQHDVDFYIFGGKEEEGDRHYYEGVLGKDITLLINRLTLEKTIYYISRMDIFLSNDTGLMHVAASQDISTVAIFGPTDVTRSGPVVMGDNKAIIISKKLACSPCFPKAPLVHCHGRTDCINDITSDEIFSELNTLITSKTERLK